MAFTAIYQLASVFTVVKRQTLGGFFNFTLHVYKNDNFYIIYRSKNLKRRVLKESAFSATKIASVNAPQGSP
jgi:hypothetical protein